MMRTTVGTIGLVAFGAALLVGANAVAASPQSARIIEHWTAERRAQAIPRDLVIDHRGYGYLKGKDGRLTPYGHSVAPETPLVKPVTSDRTGPTITSMDPAANAVVAPGYVFSASVADPSGVRSVTFVVKSPAGAIQNVTATTVDYLVWTATPTGLSNGTGWAYQIVAKDLVGLKGNSTTSAIVPFAVDNGAPPPPLPPDLVVSDPWMAGGDVQTAAGRIYFQMPTTKRLTKWAGYVCSGTVITDTVTDRSIIVTAGHCVYDDVNKAFAANVLFIPNQDGTTGTGTDLDCNNDPMGCWTPAFAVVDREWTNKSFPDNKQWDYAYYVVNAIGAHKGTVASDSLEAEAGSLPLSFETPFTDDALDNGIGAPDYTTALGYSYAMDPDFMFCAQDMTTIGDVNWWLADCDLTGGSSGGPWVQPMDLVTGSGLIISVNSWGYTTAPGMAGPQLDRNTAGAVLAIAGCTAFSSVSTAPGYAGVVVQPGMVCP